MRKISYIVKYNFISVYTECSNKAKVRRRSWKWKNKTPRIYSKEQPINWRTWKWKNETSGIYNKEQSINQRAWKWKKNAWWSKEETKGKDGFDSSFC